VPQGVWVRPPLPVPARRKRHIACGEFFIKTRRALILLLLAFAKQTLRWFTLREKNGEPGCVRQVKMLAKGPQKG